MEFAAKMARIADRILRATVGLVLILFFLYGCYALWDTWQIYENAAADEALLRYKPVDPDSNSNPSLSELAAVNPDVRGWLTLDDTHIDYPLLQAQDNMKYINTDIYGEFSLSGSLFLDYRNAPDFSDFYSLVYGHHMDAEVMFGELAYFLEEDYFERHRTGTLLLPDGGYSIELFACMTADAYDGAIFFPAAETEEEKRELLDHIETEAVHYRDVGVTSGDRIIGFSTCSEAATNARTVVFGRLCEYSRLQDEK